MGGEGIERGKKKKTKTDNGQNEQKIGGKIKPWKLILGLFFTVLIFDCPSA